MLETKAVSTVTFAVDDVTPAVAPLRTCKAIDAVRALLDEPPGRFAADTSAQGHPTHGRVEACWHYRMDCVMGIGHHPLIAAAHLAFSEHRPLVLSPDVIWVTIAQGLAQHVSLDPERYRALLVRHDGKRKLAVRRDDLNRGSPENPWEEVVADFAAQLRQQIGEFAERIVCDFSTTGPVERTVSQVVLMDVLQPYFTYLVQCICGIPSVTLEGTPTDWQRLREKVELLAPFGLDWWLGELRPICEQFARAAAGNVDREHWRRMYKIRAVYGGEVINGWLGKLFPYTEDFDSGTFSRHNPLLDPEVEAEIRALEAERAPARQGFAFRAPGVGAEALPRGLSQVQFTLSDATGSRAMDLLAGPMVVTQNAESLALRPTLGWAVRESAPIEQAMLRLAEHKREPAQRGRRRDVVRRFNTGYVPTDVLRFYRDVDAAVIRDENGNPRYRVLPLEEWTEREGAPGWRTISESDESWETGGMFRFAETSDGTELVIRLLSDGDENTDVVFVGLRCGAKVAETGQPVARSFTEFLLQAMDGGSEPYFRRAGFVPPTE